LGKTGNKRKRRYYLKSNNKGYNYRSNKINTNGGRSKGSPVVKGGQRKNRSRKKAGKKKYGVVRINMVAKSMMVYYQGGRTGVFKKGYKE